MAPEPLILMVRSFMMVQDQISNNSHESPFYPEFMEMMAGQRDREQFWPIFEIFGKYLKYLGDI